MHDDDLRAILKSLTSLQGETEWVEFKHNNDFAQEIGEYLSALSNSAALHRKDSAYIVWGVSDQPGHPIIGTSFKPRAARFKGQELENYLATMLSPRINFVVHEFECEGRPVVMFSIQPALNQPVRFAGAEYIRVGSYKKSLKDFPEKERALWALFTQVPFERGISASNASSDQVLSLIDYPAFWA